MASMPQCHTAGEHTSAFIAVSKPWPLKLTALGGVDLAEKMVRANIPKCVSVSCGPS